MGASIYIADDEKNIRDLITKFLECDGYSVTAFETGDELMEEFLKKPCELVILDIMMPGTDGLTICRRLRTITDVPIIMLTAKDSEYDYVRGITLGGDDYLTKPFNPLEIIARVKSNLRRFYELNPGTTAPGSGTRLSVGGLELDPASFSLTKDGVPVTLTPMEYKIMACLMKAPGRIFTKVQLYEAANGAYFESDENTMMVHISKLRDKVENDPKNPRYIKTVRGLGYKIENTQ